MPGKDAPKEYTASNVKQLRALAGMSRKTLTDELNAHGIAMHQNSLRRIEEGEQQVKIVEAIAFAKIFNTPLEDLITQPISPALAKLESAIARSKRQTRRFSQSGFNFIEAYIYLGGQLVSEDIPPAEQSAIVQEGRKWMEELNEGIPADTLIEVLNAFRDLAKKAGGEIRYSEPDPIDIAELRRDSLRDYLGQG